MKLSKSAFAGRFIEIGSNDRQDIDDDGAPLSPVETEALLTIAEARLQELQADPSLAVPNGEVVQRLADIVSERRSKKGA